MDTLDIQNSITTYGGTLTGSVLGGMLGSVLAGPVGLLLGLAAGGMAGEKAGRQVSQSIRHVRELQHFQTVFHLMPYYVPEMQWIDYEPAYRYALAEHDQLGHCPLDELVQMLQPEWEERSGMSHLSWAQVRPVFEHVWAVYALAPQPEASL